MILNKNGGGVVVFYSCMWTGSVGGFYVGFKCIRWRRRGIFFRVFFIRRFGGWRRFWWDFSGVVG